MLFCSTRIAVITTIMENTPTSTPSNVSPERSLCAASALIAMRKLSLISARKTDNDLFISKRLHRIHSGRAPGRQKTRRHAGQRGDQQREGDRRHRHGRGQESLHHQSQGPGQRHAHQSAEQTNARRLKEKLEQDRPPLRARSASAKPWARSGGRACSNFSLWRRAFVCSADWWAGGWAGPLRW